MKNADNSGSTKDNSIVMLDDNSGTLSPFVALSANLDFSNVDDGPNTSTEGSSKLPSKLTPLEVARRRGMMSSRP